MERLSRRDWIFIATCVAITIASLAIAFTYFQRAFPEASIDFKYDRDSSRPIAEAVLRSAGVNVSGMRNTAVFDRDDSARIFLERSLGLRQASAIMRSDVRLWFWRHRWFKPEQEEEYTVHVAPTGEIVGYEHRIPEARALPTPSLDVAREAARRFLVANRIDLASLQLVSESERNLPHRKQRIFTWESRRVRPAGAPYRHIVTVDGALVSSYDQSLRVPDAWQRTYSELRSKNLLAGNIDAVFLAITMIAALAVFIIRLRRGDLRLRFLLAIGAISVVLVTGVALNSWPATLADYDTTTSYGAFVAQFLIGAILQSFGTAMLLIVICGAGEVLYRERHPQHLAMSSVWTPRALGSKRVFRSFVLAYTLTAFFLAYQVVFYLTAARLGAWSPAEIPYDDILNSAIPWVAVLFAGFFPSLSEEFLSRAFSIPFFERVLRSRVVAIVVAGFIWGFGHATYPNQPFYIRGVEVGLAGVLLGFLFNSFGLLPLLIWHYTVDAVYTALLLFRSGNPYYVFSASLASFLFAIPLIASVVLYLKRGGFVNDDDLTNATMPVAPHETKAAAREHVELPPPVAVHPRQLAGAAVAVVAAAVLIAFRPPSLTDAIDYRIDKTEAKQIAAAHLAGEAAPNLTGHLRQKPAYARVVATPLEGFRSWNRNSRREDGGAPGGFDAVAAEHLLRNGVSVKHLVEIFRSRIQAGTWTARFFTPMKKEEYFVEVDPRTRKAVGFHKYQEESAPGARLDEPAAAAIAGAAFARHGVVRDAFELKEALSYQQPNRRDWLLHFDERQPIGPESFRRVTVRVAGDEITQFTTTIRIPDAVYRAANEQTLRNVILSVLRIAGGVAMLALLVAGFVSAAIRRRPQWRRAFRWTLMLAVVPIVSVAASYESSLFAYSTSVQWQTFFTGLSVDMMRDVALRIGMAYLALAVIDSAFPFALDLVSSRGRGRFGRAALLSAVTAIAALFAVRMLMQLLAAAFPSAANVSGFDIPSAVASPLPALVVFLEAVYDAIVGAGAVAAFVTGLRTLAKKRWLPDLVTIGVIFCATLDAGATAAQMPLMLLRAAAMAALAWAVGRFVLNGNFLSWPLAIFLALTVQGIAVMMQNHRGDLRINAIVLAVALFLSLIWIARGREEVVV